MYIIVWRNSHREPFPDVDSSGFMETYSSYEAAKEAAEETVDQQGSETPWYFDYQIYEQSNS